MLIIAPKLASQEKLILYMTFLAKRLLPIDFEDTYEVADFEVENSEFWKSGILIVFAQEWPQISPYRTNSECAL